MVHSIKSVQQAVLMNPLAFTNMIMHRTTIADERGHGYHWVLLLKLMVFKKFIALKKYCSFLFALYMACQVKGENRDELFKNENAPFPTTLPS